MTPFEDLKLPNGAVIPNRIAKAAMEENMADADHAPSATLIRLYRAWAEGGAGLLLSGNVMIDRRAMTGPGGVVLEGPENLDRFREWARTGRSKGGHFWLQINHPGRQVRSNLGQQTFGPSAIPLQLGKFSKLFSTPEAMSEKHIAEVVDRFTTASKLAEQAGFTGVQIHAAHGYLLSQFLSPLSNHRTDRWGGSLENRARLLLEVVRSVRQSVSSKFCVAVKLNSADFQRGGFSPDESRKIVEMLNEMSVDLVELSGGSYEAPAMQGESRDGRALAREAYFLEFARDVAAVAKMPIMVTGGIRRLKIVQTVLDDGVAMAGLATALAVNPNLPRDWLNGLETEPAIKPIRWKDTALAALAYMAVIKYQLRRLGQGRAPNPGVAPWWAFLIEQVRSNRAASRYRQRMIGQIARGDRTTAGAASGG